MTGVTTPTTAPSADCHVDMTSTIYGLPSQASPRPGYLHVDISDVESVPVGLGSYDPWVCLKPKLDGFIRRSCRTAVGSNIKHNEALQWFLLEGRTDSEHYHHGRRRLPLVIQSRRCELLRCLSFKMLLVNYRICICWNRSSQLTFQLSRPFPLKIKPSMRLP